MRFGAPYMAVWLWMVPLLIFFFIVSRRAVEKKLKSIASDKVLAEITGSFDLKKRKIRNFLLVVSTGLLVVALMRPQWGFRWEEVRQKGLDIMIALDTSNSMLAEDVLPNRIERAKLAIMDLVEKLHGDRVGLVVFSGTAFLQCPLTIDYNGFLLTLDDVTVNSIPIGGTSISKAIYKAIESYESGEKDEKILIIITDGEDLEGGIDKAIQSAKANGVQISCVGIGTPEGELIPITDRNGKMSFLKDSKGDVVKTRLTERELQRMALETGGMYVRATGAQFGLDLIYEKRLSKLEKKDFKSKMEKRYHERFQYPLVLAFLLLLLEPVIGDRKSRRRK